MAKKLRYTQIEGLENPTDYSKKSATETLDGIKSFTYSPVIPKGTLDNHAVNKWQLEGRVPYTGATAPVNLGATNELKAKEFDSIGTYVEKPNVNRNYEFVKLNGSTIGVYQTKVWNGSAWVDSVSNGYGISSLQYNTGSSSNGFGYYALQYNTGNRSNGFGYVSLQNNTGNNSNGLGYASLCLNTGNDSNGFGYLALWLNTGNSSNGFGYLALRYNTGSNNNVLGNNSFANFYGDTVNAKLFDATAIDMVAKTITIPNHGFGANGTYTNLRFVQGDSAVTGLSNGTIVQVKIIDANTIAFEEVIQSGQIRRNVNITNAGTGTGHKFEPQKSLSNINILGANINPTKSNQTIFAGGEAILPQSTVATIDADATNKALITKEWYNSKSTALVGNYYTKSEAVNMFVGLNGVQSIGGTKTFNESPIVPPPTLGTHVVNRNYADLELAKKSEKDTDEEWYGKKYLSNTFPFVFNDPTEATRRFGFHKPNNRTSVILVPSTEPNDDNWDWTKQIEFKDSGKIKNNGYEVAGYDDNYVNTAGGNQSHKKDLLWSRKYSFRADGGVHVIEPKGEVTTIVVTDGSDTNTEIHLPLSATNGQKIVLINASSAAWVMVTDTNNFTSQKLYNASGGSSPAKAQMELTFVVDTANAEGILTGSGHWYGIYVDEFVMI